jgi:hypothetical protein
MTALTRRRYPERLDCWHVFYGEVHVGTIATRAGVPLDVNQWEWQCGFYPGSHPGEHMSGTAANFEEARGQFEGAWAVYLPKRTEADFQEWRDNRDWRAHKRAMWARSELMPSQKPDSMMRCPCGERFDSHHLEDNLIHVPHITSAQQADGIRR